MAESQQGLLTGARVAVVRMNIVWSLSRGALWFIAGAVFMLAWPTALIDMMHFVQRIDHEIGPLVKTLSGLVTIVSAFLTIRANSQRSIVLAVDRLKGVEKVLTTPDQEGRKLRAQVPEAEKVRVR